MKTVDNSFSIAVPGNQSGVAKSPDGVGGSGGHCHVIGGFNVLNVERVRSLEDIMRWQIEMMP